MNESSVINDESKMMNDEIDEQIPKTVTSPVYSTNDRPSYDEVFMLQAFAIATRSDDLFVKHGSVLVADNSKIILGVGFNNTIRGMDMSIVRPSERDYRRKFMVHSEVNCLANTSHKPFMLPCSTTMYITGLPCLPCLDAIINNGVSTVVYADREGSILEDEGMSEIRKQITNHYRDTISFRVLPVDNKWVRKGIELISPNA